MIESVERLQLQIRGNAFRPQRERLRQRGVHTSETWPAESISSEVAQRSQRWKRKISDTEHTVEKLLLCETAALDGFRR